MKKIITLALSTIMMLSLTACGSNSGNGSNDATPSGLPGLGGNTQIANPVTTCDTLEDAAALAGFEYTVPETIDGYENRVISVINNKIVQVVYQNDDSDKITFRKGSGTDDISGDFNAYSEENTIAIDDISVTMKGSDGKIMLAVWSANDYTYSISVNGISETDMTDYVKSVQ